MMNNIRQLIRQDVRQWRGLFLRLNRNTRQDVRQEGEKRSNIVRGYAERPPNTIVVWRMADVVLFRDFLPFFN